jgi:hypothetical protein
VGRVIPHSAAVSRTAEQGPDTAPLRGIIAGAFALFVTGLRVRVQHVAQVGEVGSQLPQEVRCQLTALKTLQHAGQVVHQAADVGVATCVSGATRLAKAST